MTNCFFLNFRVKLFKSPIPETTFSRLPEKVPYKNRDILVLDDNFKCCQKSVPDLFNFIKAVYSNSLPGVNYEFPVITTFQSSLNALRTKVKNLKKSKGKQDEMEQFLEAEYQFRKKDYKRKTTCNANDEDRYGKRCYGCDNLSEVNLKLGKEIATVKCELSHVQNKKEELSSSVLHLTQKLKILEPKRVNQKLGRKQAQIEKLKSKVKKFKAEKNVRVTRRKPVNKAKSKKNNNQRVKFAMYNFYKKLQLKLYKQIKDQKDTIQTLENEIETLKEKLQHEKSEIIHGKKDGKMFSDEIRKIIYYCATKNVSLENIGSVCKFVLKTMTGKELVDFPDVSTCRRISREMGIISKLHVNV